MIMVQELIMPETQETFPYSDLQHYFASSITEIEREDWNRLAGEENPGQSYLRIALVYDAKTTEFGLRKIEKVLYAE